MARYGPIVIESKGDLKYVEGMFKRTKTKNFRKYLEYFAQKGVEALAMETPIDTAETALSWDYEIEEGDGKISIYWTNDKTGSDGRTPVAILIQYGHATRNGGYVAPYDFINPVTQEIFQQMADSIWREVSRK